MNNIILYIIETSICIALFYLIYWTLLKQDTFFGINRIYLLGSLIFSLIIPMMTFSYTTITPEIYKNSIHSLVINSVNIRNTVEYYINFWQIIEIIYFAGVVFFLVRFLIQLIRLYLLVKRNGIKKIQGYHIVFTDDEFDPFSFFNIIFLNKSFQKNSKSEQILAHEKIHINKLHSLDIIFLEIISIFQWFNPFIRLYKRAIKEVHEFQADKGVCQLGFNKINYQKLILEQVSYGQFFSITNNFNYSIIKRRIIMIAKLKTKKIAILKLFIVLPLSALLILVFSCSENSDNLFVWQNLNDWASRSVIVPDSYPEFPGDYGKYHNEHLEIPEAIIKNGVPGKIAVRFEVDKDGSIKNVRIGQVLKFKGRWGQKKLGFGCDENAIKFVSNMPKWRPAIYKGKPVKMTQSLILFFGNQVMFKKWVKYYSKKVISIKMKSM